MHVPSPQDREKLALAIISVDNICTETCPNLALWKQDKDSKDFGCCFRSALCIGRNVIPRPPHTLQVAGPQFLDS